MLPLLRLIALVPPPLAVVAGAWGVQQLSVLPGFEVRVAIGLSGLLLLVTALVFTRRGLGVQGHRVALASTRVMALATMFAALGLGLLGATWAIVQADEALAQRISVEQEGVDLVVDGHIAGLPHRTPLGWRFALRVEDCVGEARLCPAGRLLALTWGQGFGPRFTESERRPSLPDELWPGDRWRLTVRLKRPRAPHNPGLFDAELRMLQQGVAATGYVRPVTTVAPSERLPGRHRSVGTMIEMARAELRASLVEALGPVGEAGAAAGVLVALAVGDQAAVPSRWWEIFNRTGVGHLMSISGLHITMLAGLAMALCRRVLRWPIPGLPWLLLRCPAAFLHWSVGLLTAFLYAALAGWGIPAQRTCWMLAVTAWAMLSGRCRGIMPALALAAAVVTVIDPWAPTAAGFWLSFVAVAAIAIHGAAMQPTGRSVPGSVPSHLGQRWARWRPRLIGWLRESVGSQWSATLSLLPLGALFFSSYSLVSPIANALAIPLVSGLITPLVLLAAGLAIVWPTAGGWVGSLLLPPTGWLLELLEYLSRWPQAAWTLAQPDPIALALAGVGVFMLLRPYPVPMRPVWCLTFLPLFTGAAPLPPRDGLSVHALDVGQGMAVLVETHDFRLLYDTGPHWSTESNAGQRIVVPWLRARGIRRLDALVISHADLDHSGGAADLLRSIEVGTVLSSIEPGHPLRIDHPDHQPCRRGHRWARGAVRFEFLHPGDEFPPGAARSPTNARSCVLRVVSAAGSVLLPGDLEARQERDLIARLGAPALAADILLAPHHGSNTSSSAEWLEAVAPRWVIVQAGYRNRFGHPTARVLARYEATGATVLRTDQHGAVSLQLAPGRPPGVHRSRVDRPPYWRLD